MRICVCRTMKQENENPSREMNNGHVLPWLPLPRLPVSHPTTTRSHPRDVDRFHRDVGVD